MIIPNKRLLAGIALLAATAVAAAAADGTAAPERPMPPVKNVVLVHGAFADGSGWKDVHERLARRGFAVTVVQEPETSLDDDVQAVRRAIAMQDGPVVLVGHSYGGVVITEAGTDQKVRALVYVAASVPDVGESLADLSARIPSPSGDAMLTTPDGYVYIAPNRFREAFAADLPPRQADFMANSQVLPSVKILTAKVKVAAWKTKPSYAIVAGADRALSPDLERFMYERAGARTTTIPRASHAVYISHPDKVAAIIEDAAGR
nr:alpha/beta hydrolase [uncultured Massilia sp.]